MLDIEGESCKQFVSEIPSQDYILEGLFQNISDTRKNFKDYYGSEINWSETIVIAFDKTYHFPNLIEFDHPNWEDDQYAIRVRNFVVLER